MKKHLFTISLISIFASLSAQAQQQYSAQVYGGINNYYGDIDKKSVNASFGVNAGYYIKPWLSANLDVQFGKLSGGDRMNPNLIHMEFENNYAAISIMPRLYFMNISPIFQNPQSQLYISGLYVSSGVGIFMSNPKAHNPHLPEVGYIHDAKSTDLIIPIEIGYQLPLYTFKAKTDADPTGKPANARTISLTAAYRYNLGFSDGWDGYTPTVNANQNNDGMDVLHLGLQFNF